MNFFSRLFREKVKSQTNVAVEPGPECIKIQELNKKMKSLLAGERYIAKSEYINLLPNYKEAIDYFHVLMNSGMLGAFCAQNGVVEAEIESILSCYDEFEQRIDEANDDFITRTLLEEKEYLDNILKSVDPAISLDEDQRRVILTDEDYCLVIAGAGAGKTTTVAAKVKYLVEKKNIDPRDILVISFTNKAVAELREKINKNLGIDCPIATFHSTGNAILHINNPEQLNIVDGSKLYFLLKDYFMESILSNESLVNNLIMFFASYFDAPYEGNDLNEFFNKTAKGNYTTMRSDLDEFKREIIDVRTKKKVTIQNEVLRSYQEVEIANFLYLNNIEYEYEPVYPYNIAYARKPYTPDFIIRQGEKVAYIEHFGVTEDGENSRYSEEELTRYKHRINDKVKLHRAHGTTLIYTFSAYKDRKSITKHLQEKLESAGFELTPKSNKEIMEKLISSEESKYIRRLVSLICRFITNFKTNGYRVDEFNRMYHSTTNVRSRLFLNICEDCYLEYERWLKENKAVDFEDLINESARILREVKEMKQKLHFKYIIVDEYQDISRQRFDLTTALSEVCDGKIIAVGDDWQSIYAFSGSDISLFTKFGEKMGYAKLLKIVRTYRNSQEVIDIAGNFIQKNPDQIEKSLVSPKRIEDPVIIYTYDTSYKKYGDDRRSGVMYATAHAVETAIEQIISYNNAAGKKDGTILLLGRYGFDGDHLERSGLFEYKARGSKIKSVKYPNLDITFMTVHMSKGLGYDDVVVINGKNETYGFPSKIEDDPVLSFVIRGDNSIDYAEERRLFYVALTRTKNRVYFIAPEQNPSEFLLEIKKDYKNVVLRGSWNEEKIKENTTRKTCPICGYPMQFRYKNAYGLRLYLCTNDPELCGFMTNNYKAGKLAIMKCDKCRDGYLVVKSGSTGYFLGCTNYKPNRKGCNNVIGAAEYLTLKNMTPEFAGTFIPEQRVITHEKKVKVDNNCFKTKELQATEVKMTQADELCEAKTEFSNASEIISNQSAVEESPAVKEKSDKVIRSKSSNVMYKKWDLFKLVEEVLKCLIHISEHNYYGISVLIDVIRGSRKQQIKKNRLDDVPEYGIHPGISKDDLRAVIQWLINNHYMLRTKGPYPKLHPTYETNHYTESISDKQLRKLKKYLEDPNREIFSDISNERNETTTSIEVLGASKSIAGEKDITAQQKILIGKRHRKATQKIYRRFEDLTADQKRALGILESGKNVFLSGEAGTGKSYVLNEYIYRNRGKNIVVCAPTGIAAINIGGSTLHRVFNVPIAVTRPGDYNSKPDSAVIKADVIIIDEISMCRFDIFEYVVRTIKKAEEIRQNRNDHYAMEKGVSAETIPPKQIIVVGDFFQLAPVVTTSDKELLALYWDLTRYSDGFAFQSELWNELNFESVILKEVIRQKGKTDFIDNLNKIRRGDSTGILWFNKMAKRNPISGSIYLCGTNRVAEKINQRESEALSGKEVTYKSQIKGQVQMSDKLTSDELSLKVGMQVMTLVNDIEEGYQNGSLGKVVVLNKESVDVQLNTGEIVTVKPHDWEILGYEVQDDKLEKVVLGNFIQLPIKIAYAITIHKSQGQTYSSANISPDCFASGQLYVALSRVQCIEGLSLEHDIQFSSLKTSNAVKAFYDGLVETSEYSIPEDIALYVEDEPIIQEDDDRELETVTVAKKASVYDKVQSMTDEEVNSCYMYKTIKEKPNAYAPWTEEEEKQILAEVAQGMKIGEIADKHYRTNGAIRARLKKIRER